VQDISIDKPIFMIGMGRSGTSILSEAISLHEHLGWFSNYLNQFPHLPSLSILNRLTDIPLIGFYLRGKKKQKQGVASTLMRFLPYSIEAFSVWEVFFGVKFSYNYLIKQSAAAAEAAKAKTYIGKVLRLQKKNRFFAKLTGPPRIHYLLSIFPDASFIHVIRDPRAVVSSLLYVDFWKIGGGHNNPWWQNGLSEEYINEWKKYANSPVALAAVQWKRIVELTDDEKKLLIPSRYIEIRYEDFIEKPHESLSTIFQTFHLPDSIRAHRNLLSIGRLENQNFKYKRNLKKEEIITIEQVTGKVAQNKGYDF